MLCLYDLSYLPESFRTPHNLKSQANRARYHILAMGSAGTGKTASAVPPAQCRLIKAGHREVVIDVKVNLRE